MNTEYFDQPKEFVEDYVPYISSVFILVVALAAIKIFYQAIKSDNKLRKEEGEEGEFEYKQVHYNRALSRYKPAKL